VSSSCVPINSGTVISRVGKTSKEAEDVPDPPEPEQVNVNCTEPIDCQIIDSDPLVPLEPDQSALAPGLLAEHDVALLEDQLTVIASPVRIWELSTLNETETGGGGAGEEPPPPPPQPKRRATDNKPTAYRIQNHP